MPRDTSRDENIRAMYEAGMTLEQIGARHKVTRERIRQILRKIGVPRDAGGIAKKAATRRAQMRQSADLRYMQKYGVDFETMRMLRRIGVTRAWTYQRKNAKNRGIGWHLTVGQFWQIWSDSGKWPQRGRGKGKYCLARYNDSGDYKFGNVWVCEFSENCREARARAAFGGGNIHHLYPGSTKPWIAKHGNKHLGCFATKEEATAAKIRYAAGAGRAIKGWTIRRQCRTHPYQVVAERGGKSLRGYFSTQAEAEDAYRLFRLELDGKLSRAASFVDQSHTHNLRAVAVPTRT